MTRFASLALLLAFLALPAQASPCMLRDVAVALVEGQHGEKLQFGATQGDTIIEIFANPHTGSWTMLQTNIAQVSCVRASGRHWRAADRKKGTGL